MSKSLKSFLCSPYQKIPKKDFFIVLFLFFTSISLALVFGNNVFVNFYSSLSILYIGLIAFKTTLAIVRDFSSSLRANKKDKNIQEFILAHKMILRKTRIIAENNQFNTRFSLFFASLVFGTIAVYIAEIFLYYDKVEPHIFKGIDRTTDSIQFTLFLYCFIPFTLLILNATRKKMKKQYFNTFVYAVFISFFFGAFALPFHLNYLISLTYALLFLYVIFLAFVVIRYEVENYKLNTLFRFIDENDLKISDTMENKIQSFKKGGLFKEFFVNSLDSSDVMKYDGLSYANLYVEMINSTNIDAPHESRETSLRQRIAKYLEALSTRKTELENKTFDYIP